MTKRFAYAVVCDGPRFALGLAEENEAGYWLRASLGNWESYDAAIPTRDKLNAAMGLDKEDAAMIVASSMKATNRKCK